MNTVVGFGVGGTPMAKHYKALLDGGLAKGSPEYRTWQMMKNRCANPRATDYAYYGGRGIGYENSWSDFDTFLADMQRRPSPLHTIERVDNAKDYNRRNCIWATRQAQARNRPAFVKLSPTIVAEIRRLYATGNYRQIDLAMQFGSTQSGISQIVLNTAWRNEEGGAQ